MTAVYRLSERHPVYGEAGLVCTQEIRALIAFNDKDLFELVEDQKLYAKVSIIIHKTGVEYLTFDHHELLAIIMKYTEPDNFKFIAAMEVVIKSGGVNWVILLNGMIALQAIYEFTCDKNNDSVIFTLKINHGKK
jgi:hypothetical protein